MYSCGIIRLGQLTNHVRVFLLQVLERQVAMASMACSLEEMAAGVTRRLSVRQQRVVENVVYKLLLTAVADTSERVRRTVLNVSII